MSNQTADQQQPQFYGIPATIRRNAFLTGRVTIPGIVNLFKRTPKAAIAADRVKHDAKELSFETRPHGGFRDTPRKQKLRVEISLARLTRVERNRLLRQKCRAAGVDNACALALAK